MLITSHGHSDVGFVRENNEDSFLVDDHKGIYCVADGVGGLPFGNLASRMAVKLLSAMIHDSEDCSTADELQQLSHRVHRDVVECGHLVGGENGIGTTFSAIRLLSGRCIFSHVGDSSILYSDGSGLKRFRNATLWEMSLSRNMAQRQRMTCLNITCIPSRDVWARILISRLILESKYFLREIKLLFVLMVSLTWLRSVRLMK